MSMLSPVGPGITLAVNVIANILVVILHPLNFRQVSANLRVLRRQVINIR